MKRIIALSLLIIGIQNAHSQRLNDDYLLFDAVFANTLNHYDLIVIEKQAEFAKQEVFFTKNFLQDYTEPTAGVDSKKVKKIIQSVDLEYFRRQKKPTGNWDFLKSKFEITKYVKTANSNDIRKVYSIASPLYSKDYKMAFIYFQEFCGIDCGFSGVQVFKKCNGKWKLYLQIPLSVS